VNRLTVGGKQIAQRPTILLDFVKSFQLDALYLPDQKRILLNKDIATPKQRWNEGHEIGHSIIPWHESLMLGDNQFTLNPSCHELLEAEANYAARRLLFLQTMFSTMVLDMPKTIASTNALAKHFGNTLTTTFYGVIEAVDIPACGLISQHPTRRKSKDAPKELYSHFIRSKVFEEKFPSVTPEMIMGIVRSYSSFGNGPLGESETFLFDDRGDKHTFSFETFYNGYAALTLGTCSAFKG